MSSFQSQMNLLRFPLHPFAQNLRAISKKKKSSMKISGDITSLFSLLEHESYEFSEDSPAKKSLDRIGVVFSGGQAPGGHNVIWGIFDGMIQLDAQSKLIGFLGGPSGLIENQHKVISKSEMSIYANTGGFDLIGSGRTKIETPEQLEKAFDTIKKHDLKALMIIGGDDSNTNAAVLAQFLKEKKHSCCVIGIPKTIDGDLKNQYIETSFGFDSAAKIFSELTSNVARDCLSAKKYSHFIKIMGRSASHLALEVALTSHPNYVIMIEELIASKKRLHDVVAEISDVIIARSKAGKDYGVYVIPEGLIEALVDMNRLVKNLSKLIAEHKSGLIVDYLDSEDQMLFSSLPQEIQKQLCQDLDPHGNVQVSLIESEKLVLELVKRELKKRKFSGKFHPLCHFFGYEGRCCYPSYFDLIYCYHLGIGAVLAAKEDLSGYIIAISNLSHHPKDYVFKAIPLISMMHLEIRKGKNKPVIKKAYVDLKQTRFLQFAEQREKWKIQDCYQFSGPRQYHGDFSEIYLPPLILQDQS